MAKARVLRATLSWGDPYIVSVPPVTSGYHEVSSMTVSGAASNVYSGMYEHGASVWDPMSFSASMPRKVWPDAHVTLQIVPDGANEYRVTFDNGNDDDEKGSAMTLRANGECFRTRAECRVEADSTVSICRGPHLEMVRISIHKLD